MLKSGDNMIKSKELILVKIICLILVFYLISRAVNGVNIYGIGFILLLIISNNLRIFYIKDERLLAISIVIEMIFSTIGCIYFDGNISLFLIGTIIDIFIFKSNIKIIVFLILNAICIGIADIKFGFSTIIENSLVFILVCIFMKYIRSLYSSRIISDRLYEELRISEEKLKQVNEELEHYTESIEELTLLKERNRISREIHDSVGHALTTTMIQLSAIESIANKENKQIYSMANTLRKFVNDSFQDVKKAVKELKPDEYENYQGIIRIEEVCRNFEKLSGVQVKLRVSKGNWTLSTKQLQNIYRITQEVLSNSLRHGKATIVNVIINFTDNDFLISFKDNGIGTYEIKETGVGLRSIRERTEELNGVLSIESSIGEGFFVKITVPREAEI